jgi:ubiquinone/menaquinone biosynthesis C-methylase UbiE
VSSDKVSQPGDLKDLVLPDGDQHKQRISTVFDAVSSGYDDPALRFFPLCAERMVSILQPKKGWKVLDVATGTGALASALARTILPGGRVMAIDLSEGMLQQAEKNIQKMALTNVDFSRMDAESPDFPNNYFDAVACSFGLFFIPDMFKAITEWLRVTRAGGTVVFSAFTENTFRPLLDLFAGDLKTSGFDLDNQPTASTRLKDAKLCRQLMEAAGFSGVEHQEIQVGYHLKDENEWWSVVWNTAMRGPVSKLNPDEQQIFKTRHLKRVAELRTEDGIWMDVEVRLISGKVG